jgi:hypothetical protein
LPPGDDRFVEVDLGPLGGGGHERVGQEVRRVERLVEGEEYDAVDGGFERVLSQGGTGQEDDEDDEEEGVPPGWG